jgi:adenine-specific DNA-methyltransferase
MRQKYREQVKCIYIDPPYNTGEDGFTYKDAYPHSSWLTMMLDRLTAPYMTLNEEGVLLCSYKNPDNDPRGDWTFGDLTVGMDSSMRPNQFYD